MFSPLEQLVDDAAEAAGVVIPEHIPEEVQMDSKPISKSARVREYLDKNPQARNKEVAVALADFGVRPADVANVKAILKKKGDSNEATSPRVASTSATPSPGAASALIDASIQLDLLEAGIEFVRQAGGVNEAQHVLGVIRRIRSLS